MARELRRIQINGLERPRDSAIVSTCVQTMPAHARRPGHAEGIEFRSLLALGQRLVHAIERQKEVRIPMVSGCAAWIQLDRLLEFLLRALPVPFVVEL